jgi:hypothetical protein
LPWTTTGERFAGWRQRTSPSSLSTQSPTMRAGMPRWSSLGRWDPGQEGGSAALVVSGSPPRIAGGSASRPAVRCGIPSIRAASARGARASGLTRPASRAMGGSCTMTGTRDREGTIADGSAAADAPAFLVGSPADRSLDGGAAAADLGHCACTRRGYAGRSGSDAPDSGARVQQQTPQGRAVDGRSGLSRRPRSAGRAPRSSSGALDDKRERRGAGRKPRCATGGLRGSLRGGDRTEARRRSGRQRRYLEGRTGAQTEPEVARESTGTDALGGGGERRQRGRPRRRRGCGDGAPPLSGDRPTGQASFATAGD